LTVQEIDSRKAPACFDHRSAPPQRKCATFPVTRAQVSQRSNLDKLFRKRTQAKSARLGKSVVIQRKYFAREHRTLRAGRQRFFAAGLHPLQEPSRDRRVETFAAPQTTLRRSLTAHRAQC
jgi:hypothetical protein